MWIDIEHGEMTLLVGKEKLSFDLYQNMPLTDEQKRMFMRMESLLPPIKEHTPMFLQEDPLEGFEIRANSPSTQELAFELMLHIMEREEFILAHDEDDEEVLATTDDRPT